MFIRDALHLGSVDSLDRELLLGMVLHKDRSFLLAHPEYKLPQTQRKRFEKLVRRREQHEPLAYILGEKEFFHLSFSVNRFTLIPRPETELMVEEALNVLSTKKKLSHRKKTVVIDIGTGSGCILISVVKNFLEERKTSSSFSFIALDTSRRALQVAKKNAKQHKVEREITFLQSNLLKVLEKELTSFDEIIILANLPYLSETLYQKTAPTVRNFEPKTALVSGQDGLDHYRKLLQQVTQVKLQGKVQFLLEISPEQKKKLPSLLGSFGIEQYHILPDLTGRARLVQGSF